MARVRDAGLERALEDALRRVREHEALLKEWCDIPLDRVEPVRDLTTRTRDALGGYGRPRDSCPLCDGTINRALQQGREITTFDRCGSCAEREDALRDMFQKATTFGYAPITRKSDPPFLTGQ